MGNAQVSFTVPDVALADAIVARIRHITRTKTLEHAVDVAEVVAQGVYDGNLSLLRDRGEEYPLYRQVAYHRELPFSPKTLWTYLKVYELIRTFPKLRESPHLGFSHLRAVVNLPEGVQARLLQRAETDAWTSDRLEEEAQAHRHTPIHIGRPPTESFLRNIRRMERLAAELEEELAPRVKGRLGEQRVAHARDLLRQARAHIDALEAELRNGADAAAEV
jgi:hypothetical protein